MHSADNARARSNDILDRERRRLEETCDLTRDVDRRGLDQLVQELIEHGAHECFVSDVPQCRDRAPYDPVPTAMRES